MRTTQIIRNAQGLSKLSAYLISAVIYPRQFITGTFVAPSFLPRVLFVLFVIGILSYGGIFAGYMLARFDLVNLVRDVNSDDSFYYFQIAWYLSEGKFSTFDGGITQTNGYHPLWALLITPFYWVLDKETALFGIKVFEIMLIAAGVVLVSVAALLCRLFWPLLFAVLPVMYHIRGLFFGLEAAAGLFMLGLLFLVLSLYAYNSARWKWCLAAVAFALPWVRLEYVAISMSAMVALFLIEWSWQARTTGSRFVLPAPRLFVPITGAVTGILIYFAYNMLIFGGFTPVSGVSKQVWSQVSFDRHGGYSIAQNFSLAQSSIPAFGIELMIAALAICVCFPLVWWLTRRSRNWKDWLLLVFFTGMFGLAAGHLAKFVQIVLFIHPYWGRYEWYYVPAYLMMAMIVPFGCYVIIYFVRRFVAPKLPLVSNIVVVSIVLAGTVFLLIKVDFTMPFQSIDEWSRSRNISGKTSAYMGVHVMDRVLPEGSVVGSWDSGIIGYFSRFPVVNLDGLVNSYDYFHRSGFSLGKKGYFKPIHREFGVTHLANVSKHDFDNKFFKGAPDNFMRSFQIIYDVQPAHDVHAWFWEKIEPHFVYQSGDIGLLVDGRMAQAFAKNCDPDELILWSWPGQENMIRSNMHRSHSGLCVAAVVLPHDTDPSSVRVETSVRGAVLLDRDYIDGLIAGR